jgi:hypothetical protein
MSSHHFPLTHGTLAHCALTIDLTFFSLPMMPFKNGKKINSYKHSIKLKIIFVFPWYKIQREIGGLSNQTVRRNCIPSCISNCIHPLAQTSNTSNNIQDPPHLQIWLILWTEESLCLFIPQSCLKFLHSHQIWSQLWMVMHNELLHK